MSQYRLEYVKSRYRGVYGSGDDGWERSYHNHSFPASDDEAAAREAKRFLEGMNSPRSTQSYCLQRLVRIDQPEQNTMIAL